MEGARGLQIKIGMKGFEDLWEKTIRGLSPEAVAADEIEGMETWIHVQKVCPQRTWKATPHIH